MDFLGGNDCCVVLKSGMEFCAFANLPNPLRLLPPHHQAAGELYVESDCSYKGHNIAYAMAEIS